MACVIEAGNQVISTRANTSTEKAPGIRKFTNFPRCRFFARTQASHALTVSNSLVANLQFHEHIKI